MTITLKRVNVINLNYTMRQFILLFIISAFEAHFYLSSNIRWPMKVSKLALERPKREDLTKLADRVFYFQEGSKGLSLVDSQDIETDRDRKTLEAFS